MRRSMDGLKKTRLDRGYSQRALAKRSGVSPATIYELEAGRRSANPSTLRKLADALDVSVGDLVNEEREGKVSVQVRWEDQNSMAHGEELRFTGKMVATAEPSSNVRLDLYECPGGYRVHEIDELDGTRTLHPFEPNSVTGETDYPLYSAEEVAEEWQMFGAAVGVFPVRDLD
jgi:transcriptional regulator with XRE-family HTH domain